MTCSRAWTFAGRAKEKPSCGDRRNQTKTKPNRMPRQRYGEAACWLVGGMFQNIFRPHCRRIYGCALGGFGGLPPLKAIRPVRGVSAPPGRARHKAQAHKHRAPLSFESPSPALDWLGLVDATVSAFFGAGCFPSRRQKTTDDRRQTTTHPSA